MKNRSFLLLAAVILVAVIVVITPILIVIGLFLSVDRLPVEEEALQLGRELLTKLPLNPIEGSVYEGYGRCEPALYDMLKANNGDYSLEVVAAFDPSDPRFSGKVYSTGGSRDAAVRVRFADGSEVDLYFYAGHWEGCQIKTIGIAKTPISTEIGSQ